jgi:hypothetical protein
MGLLDDAIREHLDLKRRRGADPAEVERAEREALGPVRRDPFEQTDPEHGVEAGEPAYDQALDEAPGEPHDTDGDWGEMFEEETAVPEPQAAPVVEDPIASAPSADDGPPLPLEPAAVEGAAPVNLEREQPAPHAADAPAGDETAEYDVEAELGDAPHGPLDPEPARHEPEPGDDVLEETPEFLQDTPDHDRLWFEQRPPKDFDFDG